MTAVRSFIEAKAIEAKEDFKHMVWYVKDLSDGYSIVTDTDICFSAPLFGKRKNGVHLPIHRKSWGI